MKAIRGSIAIAVLMWSACKDPVPVLDDAQPKPPDAPPDAMIDAAIDPRETVAELPATPNRDLDLLFVIDDSPSMLDKQLNLASGFPAFIERLQTIPGGLPNLHIGVVTPDLGTKASGSQTPGPAIGQIGLGGCAGTGKGGALQLNGAPVTGAFLSDVEAVGGGRITNYTGTLAGAFGMMARPGAGGCGFEQPLAAMRTALDNHPANAGFLRPSAMLGVVFVTDEDDCSAKSTAVFGPESPTLGPLQSFRCTRFGVTCTQGGQTSDAMNQVGAKAGCGASASSTLIDEIAPYRDFLRGLKTDPKQVIVGGIFGPPEPLAVELVTPPGGGTPVPALTHVCMYQGQQGVEAADPAARLRDLLDEFPDRSELATICQPNLSTSLARIGDLFRRSLGTGCVEAPLADVDPGTAGLQVDCVVEDLVGSAATAVASCEASPGARPCWQLETDAAACGSAPPPNLKLVVQRAVAPDPATITRMRCLVAP